MDPALLEAVFRRYVHRLAIAVEGTEAFGFAVDHRNGRHEFTPIVHIRPDKADPQLREAAVKAFIELAEPFVERSSDGVIELTNYRRSDSRQFCFVLVLTDLSALQTVNTKGVVGIIARCKDEAAARRALELLRGYDNGPLQ